MGDPSWNRGAIRLLMIAATNTRPDIMFSVRILAQFMSNPKQEHWVGLKKVFRYIKQTVDFELHLDGSDQSTELERFADSN